MDRKKQLRQEYKEYKPPMGVFAVVCKPTGKVYLGCAQDLKGTFNSIRFQLEMGRYIKRNLQQDWNACGQEAFDFQVLEELDYDKDESKTDYREDLKILREFWQEKFTDVEVIK